MTEVSALTASLVLPAPAVSAAAVMALLRETFGLTATLEPLSSERDVNFMAHGAMGKVIVKIANPAEAERVTLLQNEMLLHLERCAPVLPVPRLIRTLDGRHCCRITLDDGQSAIVRLLSVLPGQTRQDAFDSAALARLATVAGDLSRGLDDFHSEAGKHDLLWDIARADRVADLLDQGVDDESRQLALAAIDRWSRIVAPGLPGLRWGVIHNDLNRSNLLFDADRHVTGIIDFGDAIFAPRINELAILVAYFADPGRLVEDAIVMASAYHRRYPLLHEELELLFDLAGARYALTLAITGWRAARYPDNRAYILRNAPAARLGLKALAHRPADAMARLLNACPEPSR